MIPVLLAFVTTALAEEWRLIGVYDLAAASRVAASPDEAEAAQGGFVWAPRPDMVRSCGNAKAPAGLGSFEAEAMANGLTSVLAVVLTADGPAEPLGLRDVGVSIGAGPIWTTLQPAVVPRSLVVDIRGDATSLALRQLVRTQIETRLCMEHKVGRAWIGANAANLREAFLLDPAMENRADRRYFGGQKVPVPALLGAPDACLARNPDFETKAAGSKGNASLDLVPSDVWGASLRWCGPLETAGAIDVRRQLLPLQIWNAAQVPQAPPAAAWDALVIDLRGDPARAQAATYDLSLNGRPLEVAQPLFPDASDAVADLLYPVPYRYPTVSADGRAYTVLLIPNWQVVEALRRMDAEHAEPMRTAGDPMDGVGWILANTHHLRVQVTRGVDTTTKLPNLASALPARPGLQNWGYAIGVRTAREPVVVTGTQPPAARVVAAVNRSSFQSAFLAAGGVLFVVLTAGLIRLRELWTRTPEERAAYWPGEQHTEDEQPDEPEIAVPGEEGG